MSVKEIETAVTAAIRSEGYMLIPYSRVRDIIATSARSDLLDAHGFTKLDEKDKLIFVNDEDPDGEQIFTELHEIGHQLARSADETVADNIAVFCCHLIESLTGTAIDAEPMHAVD